VGLGRTAVKTTALACVGLVCLVVGLEGLHPLVVLTFGGIAAMLVAVGSRRVTATIPVLSIGGAVGAAGASFSLTSLFLIFLKIGAIVFGSGYVLLAFLRSDLVVHHGWLTDGQLLDSVAVGQITPGPVFTTATFIGYLLDGLRGAIVATLGIFLPAFLLVAASGPLVPHIRKSFVAGAILDGVNVASLALMAVVTWQLGRTSIVDWMTVALALASVICLWQWKLNSAWLTALGAAVGLIANAIRR